jgi:ankyrin repeat protein
MQAIDTKSSDTSNCNDTTPRETSLPSPPTSPIDTESACRKREFSISFIQNSNNETPSYKRQKFDLGCLKTYLKNKGSPNMCDQRFQRSLLSWACIGQSTEAVQDLLKLVHLDINLLSGPNKTTALHEACLAGFEGGVELLLLHPDIDVNALDGQGQTALHYATQSNRLSCLKLLLTNGSARIDLFDRQGRLAIQTAVVYGHHASVSLLLSKARYHHHNPTETDMLWMPNKLDQHCAIESAIVAGYPDTLQFLLDQDSLGEKQHQSKQGLATLAVIWNRIECLQLLIKRGCILDQQSMLQAVQQRKIDMVRELAKAGVDPCLPNGQNPSFLYASNHGFLDMIPHVLTLSTSKDCIQQALLSASSLGLRDHLAKVMLHTLKSKAIQRKSS